ncbi:MAG TPA: alpha/beta hydrolase [Vicinamibacterales bacterium]|jgi:pimeloyl-ACP methyl ester carboxylesterase|nr:alpha/beta hydrolase [Vicinamibacterales bacterium]HJN42913.1 alpha/beta hydrolase [Vicinamibacterales bacterium]|tara:strand:- start:1486 stop:2631 length:1146 start_codon:yes stop_codon:yes gene_type:complete
MKTRTSHIVTTAALSVLLATQELDAQETALQVDHYVPVVSTAPSMEGQTAQIYVRERTLPTTPLRGSNLAGQVVLFVHGAGTPAEVAFDVPLEGYSWMTYLADAGFDTFAMDTTGYGRSTRPHVMNDICNLSEQQQAAFIPTVLDAPCAPSYEFGATTIESDWHDIDAVVDYLRDLRNVQAVHLVAWSLGGPRAAGYTARHPEKVERLVLLAPAYNRNRSAEPPASIPVPGVAFTKQSHDDFTSGWNRQVGCTDQYDPAVSAAVWGAMLESDPVGATWGTGVRRAPRTSTWGWGQDAVANTKNAMLLVAGIHDRQVSAARVTEMYEDLGAEQKILLDLGCASHNAMWEINAPILFDASLQWLRDGSVDGKEKGVITKGYYE